MQTRYVLMIEEQPGLWRTIYKWHGTYNPATVAAACLRRAKNPGQYEVRKERLTVGSRWEDISIHGPLIRLTVTEDKAVILLLFPDRA